MSKGVLVFFLLMLVNAGPVVAKAKSAEQRIYAMPVAETADVISTWLERNGFHFHRQPSIHQQVLLTAEKNRLMWRITLEPNSPLAAKIKVDMTQGSDLLLLKAFWHALDFYVQMPDTGLDELDMSIPEEVRGYLATVVCIFADRNGRDFQFSGFIIDPLGLIVCTAHDLQLQEPVKVRLHDGRLARGQVVKIDKWRDLSLIKVNVSLKNAISLRSGRYLLQNGDPLYAINCPADGPFSIQSGFLDGPARRMEGLPLWQARLHVDPGSSGSPVFDAKGRLSAIVKGRYRGTDSVGFLIPFETLLHFLGKY